jgi:hypothetical protein
VTRDAAFFGRSRVMPSAPSRDPVPIGGRAGSTPALSPYASIGGRAGSAPALSPIVAVVAVDAILAVVATYAALRAFDVCFRSEPNPATVVWSAHIAMFWRLGVGLYVAGPAALIAFGAARRNLRAVVRATAILVPVVGAAIAIQGALLP